MLISAPASSRFGASLRSRHACALTAGRPPVSLQHFGRTSPHLNQRLSRLVQNKSGHKPKFRHATSNSTGSILILHIAPRHEEHGHQSHHHHSRKQLGSGLQATLGLATLLFNALAGTQRPWPSLMLCSWGVHGVSSLRADST